MPKNKEIKKVLVIGSGPIVIGQAAEFDYAGTQACLALKEEGCKVILINNNPATIMTDDTVADVVYFEPLSVESVEEVIKKEQPDGLLATVGGQTGLNLALKLHQKGILDKYNVKILGTPISAIMQGEDREQFRALMQKINEPVPESEIVDNLQSAIDFADKVGYPIIVRPAYTLGGSGGGIVHNENELNQLVKLGLKASPINQCLIEKSIAGYKEIEFEVIRDASDNCIVICEMENVDPVGIHTGDSIVVVPSQTLSKDEVDLLKNSAIHIVRSLGIVGGCNVQFALHPTTKEYFVIEVNPRVSRSSALASKASGYPIAKVATKLALGYKLDDLGNANKQPELDYVVVKFPRWPFDKFPLANRTLGTQMKATGEVMALERNLESAFQKAIRSLEIKTNGLILEECQQLANDQLLHLVQEADDRRFFILLELLRRGVAAETLHEVTKITPYFISVLEKLVKLEKLAQETTLQSVSKETFQLLKENGFSDEWLAQIWGETLFAVREQRKKLKINPAFHVVDTRINGNRAYYYSSWQAQENHPIQSSKKKILIIGSGPIRIGQGIEFDYCSVHGVLALQKLGYETILINNNPETVSTDYEIADRLYFEPLAVEDVLNIIDYEQVDGVIVQYGGQTAISLVEALEHAGVPLLGSNQDTIDQLEDRERFYQLLQKLNIPHIPGETADSKQALIDKIHKIGYPVLLRPSYVIGGRGMLVLHSEKELDEYLQSVESSEQFPILIDAYYPGKEVEVDVVTDGKDIVIPAIFEHIEKAGVHSGDSMAITPPVTLSADMKETIVKYTKKIANNIQFKGIFNIQFVIYNDKLYVLEVNPRASRTVPIISKVTGINMIELATEVLLNKQLQSLTPKLDLLPENDFYTVKAPVFSTMKLPGVDPKLVPEMKSTGELIAVANDVSNSLRKAFLWNEQLTSAFSKAKEIYLEEDFAKNEQLTSNLKTLGFQIVTEDSFSNDYTFENWVKSDKAFAVVSTSENSEKRELAMQFGLLVMSSEETFQAFAKISNHTESIHSLHQFMKSSRKEMITQ